MLPIPSSTSDQSNMIKLYYKDDGTNITVLPSASIHTVLNLILDQENIMEKRENYCLVTSSSPKTPLTVSCILEDIGIVAGTHVKCSFLFHTH